MRFIWILEQINNGENKNSYFSSKEKALSFIDSMVESNWSFTKTDKNHFHIETAKNNNVTFTYLYRREVF